MRLARQPLAQGTALHQLEGKERQALHHPDFVDLHDIGVLVASKGLCLGTKTGTLLGVGVDTGQDHLDGHQPVQALLPGLVDDAHAAAAEFRQDLVTLDDRDRDIGWINYGLRWKGTVSPGAG